MVWYFWYSRYFLNDISISSSTFNQAMISIKVIKLGIWWKKTKKWPKIAKADKIFLLTRMFKFVVDFRFRLKQKGIKNYPYYPESIDKMLFLFSRGLDLKPGFQVLNFQTVAVTPLHFGSFFGVFNCIYGGGIIFLVFLFIK